jgi:hypothetical protein
MPLKNDTLRPIAPKGYVLLSTEGAKRALKAKIDADTYRTIIVLKDSIIFEKDYQLLTQKERELILSSEVKFLRKELLRRNAQLSGFVIILGLSLVFIK